MEHNCNQDNKYEFSFSHMYTKYKQLKNKNNLNSEINLAAHTSRNLGSFSPAWLPPMSCSKLFFHPWLALHLFFHLQLALHYSSTHDWLYIILPPMTIDKLYIIPPPMTDRLYTIPYLPQLLYPPPQTCIC